MHHAQNGLFFRRTEEGGVRIIKTSDGQNPSGDHSNVVCNETLTQEAFASVVSYMSKSGEAGGGYYRALDFLKQ